jgi:carboxylate-amine ligase
MTPGFERFDVAAREHPTLREMVAGELIRSEVEVRTGKCGSFAEAAAAMAQRRADLLDLADDLGYRLCAAGTHPYSRWEDQQVIDTPHYAIVESTLRYVAWRNNTFGLHVHVGINGADRAIAVNSALRSVLPELLAFSGSSPWLEGRHTHLHSTRTEIFTKFFPRCGIPDSFSGWDQYAEFVRFLIDTRSIREHTEIWWSVRPHQAYPTVETRICDGQPEFARSVALSGLMVALTADFARRFDAGEPLPAYPGRDLEENMWRAIRWGLDGEMIDFRNDARVVPTRRLLEEIVEWTAPARAQLGIELELPERNGAQRARAAAAEGRPIEEIYRHAVDETKRTYAPRLAAVVDD